jgi:medium-chain acyl-[acyl-carrier-protein] hydrolase
VAEHARSSTQDRWLPPLRRMTGSGARLFCFPYAGGSATAFATWPERLPGVDVRPVHLPGRGSRLHEMPIPELHPITQTLAVELLPLLDRPFAFFGHSMGALLAFEMTRYLTRHELPLPTHLFASGRRAPQIRDEDVPSPGLPDAEITELLRTLGGTPPEVLDEPELIALILPALRADFAVCASYEYSAEPPLACPITVFGGDDDEESAPGYLEAWQDQTTAPLRIRKFPGGHFFLQTHENAVLEEMGATIRQGAMRGTHV